MAVSNLTLKRNKKLPDFCSTTYGTRETILALRFLFALTITTTLAYDVYNYPSDIFMNLEYLSYWGAYQIAIYFWMATILGIVDLTGAQNKTLKQVGKLTGILY
jgi:hypothetical protein